VLVVIEHGTCREHRAAITAHPRGEQVTQQARHLLMNRHDRGAGVTFLIRDRDATFTAGSGAVLAAEGVRITKGPGAGAIAERWIASARRECLDQMLITSERHLRLILDEYADHSNSHRPHRARHQGRLPGVRIHPLRAQTCGFCAGTGSAA
jgi:putative transposase